MVTAIGCARGHHCTSGKVLIQFPQTMPAMPSALPSIIGRPSCGVDIRRPSKGGAPLTALTYLGGAGGSYTVVCAGSLGAMRGPPRVCWAVLQWLACLQACSQGFGYGGIPRCAGSGQDCKFLVSSYTVVKLAPAGHHGAVTWWLRSMEGKQSRPNTQGKH